MNAPGNEEMVKVENLKMYFPITRGILRRKIGDIKAVDDVSFTIRKNETLGLVGESGCGKSVSQLSTMQLIRAPGEIASGKIIFEGQNLLDYEANGPEMRSIRGARSAPARAGAGRRGGRRLRAVRDADTPAPAGARAAPRSVRTARRAGPSDH